MSHGRIVGEGYKMSSQFRRLALLGSCFAALFTPWSTPAHSTPIHYNESTDGDLPETAPFPVLDLGSGANTISGSSTLTTSSTAITDHDFDSFAFTVPAGMQLTSIQYTSQVTSSVNPGLVQFQEFLDTEPSLVAISSEFIQVVPSDPSAGASLSSVLPVGPGEYLLFQGQFEASTNENANWDYTWTLTVVPEPSSILMLSTTIGLLGAVRRRRPS
jgi:hypothetical protein